MKVGFDFRVVDTPTRNRGIGYFTYNLLLNLLRLEYEKADFVIYTSLNSKYKNDLEKYKKDLYLIPTMVWPKKGLRRLDPLFSLFWKKALKDTNPDLLHIPSLFELFYFSVPENIKTIVTIHDLIPLVYLDKYFTNEKSKKWYLKKLDQIKKCKLIIADSIATKKDLIEKLNINSQKIIVVYGGVDTRFKPISRINSQKILSHKYSFSGPFILSIGAHSYHKNMSKVFETFREIIKSQKFRDLKLVVVCKLIKVEKDSWEEEIKKLKLSNNIVLTGFIPDEDMVYFYNAAELLFFPSLKEGFGLPILEAMACGTPVITSNTSSMPEVGGDAAYYVNPYSIKSIANGLIKVLGNDNLRKSMAQKGIKQASKFTWEKAAKKTFKVYEDI